MYQARDFDYYAQLNQTVSLALLHLYGQMAQSTRFTPTHKRNDILVKFLKPKLKDKNLYAIRAELRRLLNTGRQKNGDLEYALNQINEGIQEIHINGALKLHSLLEYLGKEQGLNSELFVEGTTAQYGVMYLLEEHITEGFNADTGEQLAPVSILIQHERALELLSSITHHGAFMAELKEWNAETHQAHIQLHPIHI